MSELGALWSLRVADVMTADVVSATPSTPAVTVADQMIRSHLRAIPVVNENHAVVGLITDRHVMDHFLPPVTALEDTGGEDPQAAQLGQVPVRELMDRSVMCVNHDQALPEVAALMINKDIEHFPVVAEGSLVGFLTRGDILRRLVLPRGPGSVE